MPFVDEAQREALASMPTLEQLWDAVRIDHPTLAQPIYLVRGPGVDTAIDIEPPGTPPLFIAVDMTVRYAGFDEKGQPTDMALKIDGVSGRMVDELFLLCSGTTPPTCDIWEVNPANVSETWLTVPGITITRAQHDGTSIALSIQYSELSDINAPPHVYDRTRFPMLYR